MKRIIFFFIYLMFIAFVMYKQAFGSRFSFVFPLLIPIVYLLGKDIKKFLHDWAPFYLVLFVYDQFHGIEDNLLGHVNKSALVQIETALFGTPIPNVFLQKTMGQFASGISGVILTFFYLGQYILPILFFFYLWNKDKNKFRLGMYAFLTLNLLAFLTFVIFPAYPPWLASQEHIIPLTHKYLNSNLEEIFKTEFPVRLFNTLRANQFAPFPSLHAADPFLLFLISRKIFTKSSSILLLANFMIVSFTLVLFAEHFVVDIIAGCAYSLFSFFLARKIDYYIKKRYLPSINS